MEEEDDSTQPAPQSPSLPWGSAGMPQWLAGLLEVPLLACPLSKQQETGAAILALARRQGYEPLGDPTQSGALPAIVTESRPLCLSLQIGLDLDLRER